MGEGTGSGGTLRRFRRTRFAWAALCRREQRTTVKDRKKEIGKGLLNKMLADLGIDRDEFYT